MTFTLLVVLALAVAGIGCGLRRRFPKWGPLLVVFGLVGCAAALFFQLRETLLAPAPKGPSRAQAVVAYYLANQVLRDIGNDQGKILLLFPPDSVMDEESVGTYVDTFGRVLRGFPDLKIQVAILKASKKLAQVGTIPLSAFREATSNALLAVACVSFTGAPADLEKLLPAAQERPRFFVFDPWGNTNWLAPLKNGYARAVIVPRPGVRPDAEPSGEPQEVFNQLYLLATPATAEKIASQLREK